MDSRVRHVAKSITWRAIATGTTVGVTAVVHGGISSGELGLLVFLDVSVKLLLYYLHERFWFKSKFNLNTRVRHVIKAFSWRFIAGATTFVLVVLIFREQQEAMKNASMVTIVETVLKMLFYYGHEEAWYRINLGLDNRKKNQDHDR